MSTLKRYLEKSNSEQKVEEWLSGTKTKEEWEVG